MIERTLVLLKPDAVQRSVSGELITRFEKAGLKIVGMKMVWCDEKFAKEHYTEDITRRRGEHVRNKLLRFLQEGPVIALCLEGVNAIEVVRKLVGDTEPRKASPGTIRGDYAHHTYEWSDAHDIAIKNLIHASSDKKDAEREIKLWFAPKEMHSYRTVHDVHTLAPEKNT
jgi:nucleoside-diphosphate kinase